MRWTTKAKVQRVCARAPLGHTAYRHLQRRFGTLTADPTDRLMYHWRMASWLVASGRPIADATFLEVGTGFKPTLPLLWSLGGARTVTTVDLHPIIQVDLVQGMLAWVLRNDELLATLYEGLVDPAVLEARLAVVAAHRHDPLAALDALGIRTLAPADAAHLADDDHSIDVHFSATTLEHIEPDALRAILGEARRVLRPGGAFLHFIDPGDHFADGTDEITDINFLQYSDEEWERLAGNQFGYCNRLRASDHRRLIEDAGFAIERFESTVPADSRAALDAGFPLDARFAGYDPDDLCAVLVQVLAHPGEAATVSDPAAGSPHP